MKRLLEALNRWMSPPGIVVMVFVGLLLLVLGAVMSKAAFGAEEVSVSRPDIIEVVEIAGEINSATPKSIKAQVDKINENAKIKAVLLVVDTPGGGASASAQLYQELSKIKVPVVGYCASICTSGGMYALMAPSVKYIAVDNHTVAGSIGVIAQVTRFHRLLDWAKIDIETYKSGEFKDDANPTRAVTDAERKRIQSYVEDLAQSFYDVVLKARPKVNLEAIKPAGIFRGPKAVAVGLADAVMTRDEAIRYAKQLSGSKLIFTREELGKMSKAAQESTAYKPAMPEVDFRVARALDDLHFFVSLAREIRAGESVRFEYRAPYMF